MADIELSRTRFVVTNVPWDNTYRHAYWFGAAANGSGTTARRNAYFESLDKVVDVTDFNFVKFGDGYVDVQRSWNVLRQNNYIWWVNSSGGASGNRPFYAFITRMEVLNTRVTRIFYELDVIQSFGANLQFMTCVIEQEMETAAQSQANLIPEGLNIGEDYIMYGSQDIVPFATQMSLIVVCKQEIHVSSSSASSGTLLGLTPDSLVYYALPFMNASANVNVNVLNRNFNRQNVANFMRSLVNDGELAVVAANNIVNMYIVPGLPFTASNANVVQITNPSWDSRNTQVLALRLWGTIQQHEIFRQNITRTPNMGSFTHHRKKLNYPYNKIIISDHNGGILELKPELFNDRNRMEVGVAITIGPTPVMCVYPINYGATGVGTRPYQMTMNGMYSFSQNDINFPSDLLGAFIQGNKNQLKAQQQTNYEDLKWKQAVRSANFQHDMVAQGITGAQSIAQFGTSLKAMTAIPKAWLFGRASDVKEPTMGAINAAANLAHTANDTVRGIRNNGLQRERYGEEYAQKARQIYAQQSDIANLPPNTTVASNNLHFMLQHNLLRVTAYFMMPQNYHMQRVDWYWHLYGTKTNRVGNPRLTARPVWNYIKMTQCNVRGDCPEEALAIIREIFEAGITLWMPGRSMMNYSPTNI